MCTRNILLGLGTKGVPFIREPSFEAEYHHVVCRGRFRASGEPTIGLGEVVLDLCSPHPVKQV